MIKINMDIPGWTGIEFLQILGTYVKNLPDHSNILEIGACFGRSTYDIGKNKKENSKLIFGTLLFYLLEIISIGTMT